MTRYHTKRDRKNGNKSQFKKGLENVQQKKPLVPAPEVQKYKHDEENHIQTTYVSRPRTSKTKRSIKKDDSMEYFITQRRKQEDMWNDSFSKHNEFNSKCRGKLGLLKVTQAVLSTSWRLKCKRCSFLSKTYEMYDKSPHGPKGGGAFSTLNLSLGAAMLGSPFGPTVCQEFFLTLGIDPGSRTGMQACMTKSGKIIEKLGEANLIEEQHSSEKQDGGLGDVIKIDGRYNNPIGSSKAPHTYQPATQAVLSVISENTKKVIDIVTANMLCPKQWQLSKRGINSPCPNHPGCVANLKYTDQIGDEGRYARESAQRLKKTKTIRAGCADGDSRGLTEFEKALGKKIEKLKDPRHLSQAQKGKISRSPKLSKRMFPAKTKKQQLHFQNRFSEDLKLRCTAEITAAIRLCPKDSSPAKKRAFVEKKLKFVPHAIVMCYRGNHKNCQQFSLACHPQAERFWGKKCLPEVLKKKMNINCNDKVELVELIKIRLGKLAIQHTYENISTNHCESMNRAFSKTNPKNITSTTNFRARILSSVLQNNLGLHESVKRVHQALGHQVSENVNQKLIKHTKSIRDSRQRHKSEVSKNKRISRKMEKYALHNNKNSKTANQEPFLYSKGITIFDDILPGPSV